MDDYTPLSKEDYTMSFHKSRLNADGKVITYGLITMPLSISAEKPRIMVCAVVSGGRKQPVTAVSEPGRNDVELRIDDYTLIVEGTIKDGKYEAVTTVPSYHRRQGVTVEEQVRTFGEKGHVVVKDDEGKMKIHVMPASMNNTPGKRYTHCVCFIENNGEEELKSSSLQNGFVEFENEGKEYKAYARWAENGVLYFNITQ